MKILMLAGGTSSEREVSLATGQAVYDAMRRLDHTVYAIDLQNGKSLISSDGKFLVTPTSENSKTAMVSKTDPRALTNAITSPGFQDIEVIFIALHGGTGENGTVQCVLDLADKIYTGSSMLASAMAMNKAVAKRLFEAVNIPTPNWELYRLRKQDIDDKLVKEISDRFELPIIIKPNDSGSTIGLTKVDKTDQIEAALKHAYAESHEVLVETFIGGRELTVSVIDGEALPVVEIIPTNELYDYEAKYTKGKSNYVAPADIDDKIATEMQKLATEAYIALDAMGLARIDFILSKDNKIFCLELNSLPGLTELSLAPMAAAAAGISYDELINRILQSAVEK